MIEARLQRPHRIALFSLACGNPLLRRVCERLGTVPARHEERDFEDGEHKIRPLESVRGRDVYLVESLHGDRDLSVNDKLARFLFFAGALRDAGAGRLTAVVPYLCYARKDRRTKPRDPVTIRYVAALFEAVGIDRVVGIDVHNPAAFENAFRVPTLHLTAAPLLANAFAEVAAAQPTVVVSPDAGGLKRAEHFRGVLAHQVQRHVDLAFVAKFRSQGEVRGGGVGGEVEGRVAIILDDLVSSGTTLARAAAECLERGARAIYAAATHGVFSADAARVLGGSRIERLTVLDTVPVGRLEEPLRRRLQVIDCAPLVARSIHALHTDGALVELTG